MFHALLQTIKTFRTEYFIYYKLSGDIYPIQKTHAQLKKLDINSLTYYCVKLHVSSPMKLISWITTNYNMAAWVVHK